MEGPAWEKTGSPVGDGLDSSDCLSSPASSPRHLRQGWSTRWRKRPLGQRPGTCAEQTAAAPPAFTIGAAVAPGDDAADAALVGATPVLVASARVATLIDDLLLNGNPHAVVARQGGAVVGCGEVSGSIVDGELLVGLRPVGANGFAGVALLDRDDRGILGLGEQEVSVRVFLLSGLGGDAAIATPTSTPPPAPTSVPADPAASPTPGGTTLDLVDFAFQPSTLTIPANTATVVPLVNKGAAPHNFSIDALKISQDVNTGQTAQVTINAPAGTYQFYCNKPGHRELGMVGTLTVP